MKNKKHISKRLILVILSAVILIVSLVGVTVAFIIDKTDPITNTFKPSQVSCQVIEESWVNGSTVKEDVKILNSGDTDAYVRTAIVVNWQNEDGEILGIAPVLGDDYTIDINDQDWIQGSDGYYYHRSIIESGTNSSVLIENCTVTAEAPADGYTLSVEILASAVQSSPATAVNDAWGASVSDDGILSPAN